jgi:hypothetical protein
MSVAVSSLKYALFSGDKSDFFDTLALLKWRHSRAVLADVREAKRATHKPREIGPLVTQSDLDFLSSMRDQFDLFSTTATGTIVASCKSEQVTCPDNYLELFRLAEQGKALNTSFQFHSFLNFLGANNSYVVGRPLNILDLRPSKASPYHIIDGQHCYFVLSDIQDFWVDVRSAVEANEDCVSTFDILRFVRSNLLTKIKVKTRRSNAFTLTAPKSAPFTHEWVHGFVLWTGISPPAQASEIDIVDVNQTQRLRAKENRHELFYRQENRSCRARARRARHSGRSSETRSSSNRHLISSHKASRLLKNRRKREQIFDLILV